MLLLKGMPVAKKITEEVRERVSGFKRKPCLAIVIAGTDGGSLAYASGAKKRMESCGIDCRVESFPEDVSNEVFQKAFRALNEDNGVDGILVMTPLPAGIDYGETVKNLRPEKDMDSLTDENRVRIYRGTEGIRPCTPEAVLAMLDHYEIPVAGKNVTVVGRSLNVGRPLAHMLMDRNATVTLCHSKTADLPASCREAEILAVAIGRAGKINENCVRPGAVVIDVGTNVNEEGKLVGDVVFDRVKETAGALSPVPGGVGSVTTSVLARHVADAYEKKEKGENGN